MSCARLSTHPQVRIKLSSIVNSISAPTTLTAPAVASLLAGSTGGKEWRDSGGRSATEASCEGWFDLCLLGRPVVGPEGVAGAYSSLSFDAMYSAL